MDLKQLFTLSLAVLLVASVITQVNLPAHRGKHPVLYWATDDDPARAAQVANFEQWLRRHRYPKFKLRLDFANADLTKDIILGVSGDGDDLMDMYGFGQMNFMRQCGLLYNVAPAAKKMGFDAVHTWPALESDLISHGQQYLFPRAVDTLLYWVNQATFAKYHQPPPPRTWTFAEFQRIGEALVRAANPPGKRQRVFFADQVNSRYLRRSLGLSTFNETLTRCILNDPRYIHVLHLMYRWTFEDHLLPTPAQAASVAAQAGFLNPLQMLFNSGNVAMIYSGRFALVQLRRFHRASGLIPLAVSDPPYGKFPNSVMIMAGPAVYIGSAHKKLAEYFLAYLAGRAHNMQIVRDCDAMPPNPIYTRTREFLNPPEYPNEWGCGEAFARAARRIAIPKAYSPFVLSATVTHIVKYQVEAGFMAGIYTARQAARLAADRVNQAIAESIRQSQRLQRLYKRLVHRQEIIDQLRGEGRKVPLRLIGNPFYQRYYVAQGWARRRQGAGATPRRGDPVTR